MYTIIEILNLTKNHLEKMKVPHPRRQAEELIGEALGIGRMGVYLDFERPLIEAELERCRSWLLRRSKGEPLQYICGKVEFFGCTIKVTSDVLIPRQETEILVDKIAKKLEKIDLKNKILWDICCGSGCIGISLKKRFPQLTVVMSDISLAAIEIASDNAKANEVDVECLNGDLFGPFQGKKADFIVCNPPYIAEKELAMLDVEVRLYEPKLALVSGSSGLEIYERLADNLLSMLNPKGKVWFEIGAGQKSAVKALFCDPKWSSSEVESDWAGHDRFFSLEME